MNENKANNGASKRRKALSATLAIAMALTMLLSGTLAYFYQSKITNTLTNTEKNAIAHDDFFSLETKDDGSVVYNKDIYVENLGAEPIFVRVKLSEDLTLDGKPVTVDASGKLAAVTHIPAAGSTASVGTGQKDSNTGETDIHKYFTWDMGNGSTADKTRTYYLSASADAYHDENTVDETTGETKDPTPDIYITEDGVAQNVSDEIYAASSTMGRTKRLYLAEVITMEEYKLKTPGEKKAYAGWVIDNSEAEPVDVIQPDGSTINKEVQGDGWAYWSQPVKPYETTSLLLNGVTVAAALADRAYTYNIHVDFEVVDKTDKGLWLGTKSTATNRPGETITTDQVVTTGAIELLNVAESNNMSATEMQKVVEIASAMENAESESAKQIYQQAISAVAGSDDSEFTQARIEKLVGIAESIEQKKKEQGAALEAPALTLKKTESGDWAIDTDTDTATGQPKTITALQSMDPGMARYILDNYGGGDDILTKEEALTVTSISYGGEDPAETVYNDLSAISKKNFENLLELSLFGKLRDASFNEDNMVIYEADGRTVKASIESLVLQGWSADKQYALETFDLSKLIDLMDIHLMQLHGPNIDIQGIDQLSGLRKIYLNTLDWKMTETMFAGLVSNNPKMERLEIFNMDIYKTDASGKPTTIDNRFTITKEGVQRFNFGNLKNLHVLSYFCNTATGIIDLSGCPITYIRTACSAPTVAGESPLTVWVKDRDQITYNNGGKSQIITKPNPAPAYPAEP